MAGMGTAAFEPRLARACRAAMRILGSGDLEGTRGLDGGAQESGASPPEPFGGAHHGGSGAGARCCRGQAYRYRDQLLDGAIEGLEPKAVGRPVKERPDGRTEEFEGQVKELKRELLASEIREELRNVVPGIGRKKKRENGGGNDRS
jgi:hypothetical protein